MTKNLPLTLPGGQLMPHMSARRRHEICDTVFEMLGGTERLRHEANRNPEAYWDFMTKLWGKGLPRAVATEHSVDKDSVEELLKRLDQGNAAATINGNSRVIDEDNVTDVEDDSEQD